MVIRLLRYSLTITFSLLTPGPFTFTVALVRGPSGTMDTGFYGLGTLRDEHGIVVTKKGCCNRDDGKMTN